MTVPETQLSVQAYPSDQFEAAPPPPVINYHDVNEVPPPTGPVGYEEAQLSMLSAMLRNPSVRYGIRDLSTLAEGPSKLSRQVEAINLVWRMLDDPELEGRFHVVKDDNGRIEEFWVDKPEDQDDLSSTATCIQETVEILEVVVAETGLGDELSATDCSVVVRSDQSATPVLGSEIIADNTDNQMVLDDLLPAAKEDTEEKQVDREPYDAERYTPAQRVLLETLLDSDGEEIPTQEFYARIEANTPGQKSIVLSNFKRALERDPQFSGRLVSGWNEGRSTYALSGVQVQAHEIYENDVSTKSKPLDNIEDTTDSVVLRASEEESLSVSPLADALSGEAQDESPDREAYDTKKYSARERIVLDWFLDHPDEKVAPKDLHVLFDAASIAAKSVALANLAKKIEADPQFVDRFTRSREGNASYYMLRGPAEKPFFDQVDEEQSELTLPVATSEEALARNALVVLLNARIEQLQARDILVSPGQDEEQVTGSTEDGDDGLRPEDTHIPVDRQLDDGLEELILDDMGDESVDDEMTVHRAARANRVAPRVVALATGSSQRSTSRATTTDTSTPRWRIPEPALKPARSQNPGPLVSGETRTTVHMASGLRISLTGTHRTLFNGSRWVRAHSESLEVLEIIANHRKGISYRQLQDVIRTRTEADPTTSPLVTPQTLNWHLLALSRVFADNGLVGFVDTYKVDSHGEEYRTLKLRNLVPSIEAA